jgi:hypothetical protein
MRLGLLILISFIGLQSIAQPDSIRFYPYGKMDSVYITKEVISVLDLYPDFASDCAHGHICCQAGCGCCTELSRAQVYDSKSYRLGDGARRTEVFERYNYAATHAPSTVQYVFTDQSSEVVSSYYSAARSEFYRHKDAYRMGNQGEQRAVDSEFKSGNVGVFDENRRYFIITYKGEIYKPNYPSKEKLTDDLYCVSLVIAGSRWYGFTNKDGNEVGKGISYKFVGDMNAEGNMICQVGYDQYSLVNKKGESVFAGPFIDIKDLGEGLFAVRTAKGFQLVNDNGEYLGKIYEGISNLSDGMISFSKNRKVGFLNKAGEVVIRAQFEWAQDFHDDRAAVMRGKQWGFIDKTGRLIIPCKFDRIRNFDDDRAPVAVGSNSNTDKWGVINKKGEYILDPKYDEIYEYKNGLAKVNINGQGEGFIDREGKELFECIYFVDGYGTKDSWFRFGKAIIRPVGGHSISFLINEKGEKVLEIKDQWRSRFVQLTSRSEFVPLINVTDAKNRKSVIDLEGNIVISKKWDAIYVMTEEWALVGENDSWSVLNFKEGFEKVIFKGTLNEIPTRNIFSFKNEKSEIVRFDIYGNEVTSY